MIEKEVLSRRLVTPDDLQEAREGRERAKALAGNADTTILVQEDDPRYQAALSKRRCGDCTHFNNELALQAMREQRFVERMVKDDAWREQWFNNYESYGVCEVFSDSGGLRLVDPNAPAICAASDLDSSLGVGTESGSVMTLCPEFTLRTEASIMVSSRSGVRGPTKRDREARAYVQEHDARRKRGEVIR